MGLLQIIADPLEIMVQIQVVHPIGVTSPELNEEIEEEVGVQAALPIPRWNYREMIINLIMIIYWLKCIIATPCYKYRKICCILEPLEIVNGEAI